MEQLKEVLKYKFWILLGVGLIMTFTGWWMATGALAATIKARKDALANVEKSIPSAPQSIPNARWTSELSKLNDQQQALVTAASRELWERQKARMTWPANVTDFAKQIPIRGEFPTQARELYRTNYIDDAERVWKTVRPIHKFDGSGIVEFPGAKFPKRNWGDLTPTSAEMWDAQEDLWLLEPILEAIRDLNGDESSTRLDAAVYVINKLELVGGKRGEPISAPASGGSESNLGDAGSMASMMPMGGGGGSGGGGGGGGALAGAKFTQVSADFNYKEEFGDGGSPPWQAAGNGQQQMMTGSSNTPFGAEGGGGGGATESNYRRYVDDDAGAPYKTRGFYLSVVMDHRRVPELIAALTANGKSDWPIEIVRVQVARLNPDDGETSPGGGPGPMMAGGGAGGAFPEGAAGGSGSGFTPNYAEASGFGGAPEGGGAGTSGFASELAGPTPEDGEGLPMRPNSNTAAFQNVVRDPFVARVALCGLIYLYNPVEPPPAAPVEETAPSSAPAADPLATAAEGTPAEPTTTEPMPAAEATEPATTPPATPAPAAPADGTPAAPAEPKPATPENEAAPPN